MSRIARQRQLADEQNARALARGDEARAARATSEDERYEEIERAGMRLDHAEPLAARPSWRQLR